MYSTSTRVDSPGCSFATSGDTLSTPVASEPPGTSSWKWRTTRDALRTTTSARVVSPSAVAASLSLVVERTSVGSMPRPTHLILYVRLSVVRHVSSSLWRVPADGEKTTSRVSVSPGRIEPRPSPGCTSSSLGSGRKPRRCGSADGL